jgi:hypothetical protein
MREASGAMAEIADWIASAAEHGLGHLCAVRRCASKGEALRLELAVKQLPRPMKETLTSGRRFRAFALGWGAAERARESRACTGVEPPAARR